MAREELAIEVVYALAGKQDVVALTVAPGTTVGEAVGLSGLAERHPQANLGSMQMGIFGRVVAGSVMLRDGDRVEIYRPLMADPKQARRRRATRSR